jgi:hypothetical protein
VQSQSGGEPPHSKNVGAPTFSKTERVSIVGAPTISEEQNRKAGNWKKK